MSTRTGEIGTYLNARRKKGGERRKDKEGEKMEKGGSGERERNFTRDCTSARSTRRMKKRTRKIEKNRLNMKKKNGEYIYDAGNATCGIGGVAGPYMRKYPRC